MIALFILFMDFIFRKLLRNLTFQELQKLDLSRYNRKLEIRTVIEAICFSAFTFLIYTLYYFLITKPSTDNLSVIIPSIAKVFFLIDFLLIMLLYLILLRTHKWLDVRRILKDIKDRDAYFIVGASGFSSIFAWAFIFFGAYILWR